MPVYAAFDIGGTQLKYGLVDEALRVVFKGSAPTPAGMPELMELMAGLYRELKGRAGSPISSVGFGIPGIYDLQSRRILQSPNIPALDGYDLDGALGRFLDVPYRVENDANAAAYGEWAAGAGRGVKSLVFLTVGTGIGGGIILDGSLWQGRCGFAGEIGHVVVHPDGRRCNCGNRGCLETESSAPAIVRKYEALAPAGGPVSAEEIYERAEAGNAAAREAYADAGYYLGIGLGILINLLNPEKILLGGGVMTRGDLLLGPALEEARRRSYRQAFACCSIDRASLGNDAGLIGAAAWAKAALPR